MTAETVVFFELGVSVPAQQFRIEYTLVEKGGFPFVPEFLLRLLRVSALTAADIAQFFGFSPKELNTALEPFIFQGEVHILPDGRFALSEKGHRLFEEGSEKPVIKSRQENRKSFSFDLLTFSYLGSKHRSEGPKRSVVLHAGPEIRAKSIELAEEAFQRNIHEIHRRGDLCGNSSESQPPEIYKISDVKKERESWSTIEENYCLHPESLSFSFTVNKGIAEKDDYINQRTNQLSKLIGQDTLPSIMDIADYLGDTHTLELLSDGRLNCEQIVHQYLTLKDPRNSKQIRLYGSLQLNRNWDQLQALLKKHSERIVKAGVDALLELSWLSPAAHGLWGKCSRHGQILSEFIAAENVKIKGNTQKVFDARILIPMADNQDKSMRNRAKTDNTEAIDKLHGFIESINLAPLEVITLSDSFACVIYHLVQPDLHPVPIPFGFITEELGLVRKIKGLIDRTLSEYTSHNQPRYLGQIFKSPR